MADLTPISTTPVQGGQDSFREPGMLPNGTYSSVQNMRNMIPGMKARPGMAKLHVTADVTNRVLSLYQYSKGKRTERHMYAHMSDGDILEAGTAPPGVAGGVFGAEVFSGASGTYNRGIWSVIDDKLLFSNGVDQHQICAGTDDYVDKFVTYSSATALPAFPTIGADYTEQVNDVDTATVAALGALGTNATDAICICTKVQANRLYFTMTASVNAVVSAMTIYYCKSDNTWASVGSVTDGTMSVATKTLSGSGYITWTAPTDAITKYMYNVNGFWLKIIFSAALTATVNASQVTYGSAIMPIQDVWDGAIVDCIEAQLFHTSYYTYATDSINIGTMAAADTLVFNCADPAEHLYIDIGTTPNTNAAVMTVKFLSTAGTWTSITKTDGTIGVAGKSLSQSGFVVLGRQAAIKKQSYNYSSYEAYWYQITFDATLSGAALTDINIGIQYVPYFTVSDYGIGLFNTTWKNRAVFVFDKDPSFLVISADGSPQVLSGLDSSIYQVGDGRANKIVAVKRFYNEMLAAQEEKGTDGGCITLVQGTTPANMGKIVLSNVIGAMNSECMEEVDGCIFGGQQPATMAFILSRRGIYYTDGRTVQLVPNFEKVRNYFDPSNSNCIRSGYETHMFLKYDSAYNVLKIGLVTTSTGAVCNKWLVYDLRLTEFMEDNYTPALACMCEAEAASGNVPILQIGGGTADGFVYLLNSTTSDVAAAIDSFVIVEYNSAGLMIVQQEMIVRVKTQAAGDMTITIYSNGISASSMTKTLTAETANDRIRRHRFNLPQSIKDSNISIKYQHNTTAESFYLLDWGVKAVELENV